MSALEHTVEVTPEQIQTWEARHPDAPRLRPEMNEGDVILPEHGE